MLVQETWPSYKGIDKDGVGVIISETGYTADVKYGRTKLFIRTPRTVFELEKLRAEIVPTLVLFLQRVRRNYLLLIVYHMSSANFESPRNKNSATLICYLQTTSSPSFSLSWVTRSKTTRKKMAARNPGREKLLSPGFMAAIFFRRFIYGHTRRTKRRGD